MDIYREKEACCGCGACVDICPAGAARMVQDREGFYYPEVDGSACTECGKCRRVCPVKARKTAPDHNLYFGAQAKKDEIRYSGSSGGIFTILSQFVIEQGGSVYGAGYRENMKVAHREAKNKEQLEQIKKTKYVQSNLKGIYIRIERELKEDKWVLFCGTPCQAQALLQFLNGTYQKLILVDLVCYGVPSPGVWKDYVEYLEKKHKGKMTDFVFRDKRNADQGHTCSYQIGNKEYTDSIYRNIFCRMYFKNYILRPACHSCRFCTVNRNSDFTIGDFWGVERIRPDMEDGMGTSVVIVHTDPGRRIWNEVKEELKWFECKRQDVLQPRLLEPTARAKGRRIFWMLYRRMPFWMIGRLTGR